ncbi:hypothetical protein [Paracoccus lutimaris]|uniref:Uncharacterized protein n=1 Tax=Paracoccus lutimaris TaxID=1490030 RepID=A0A368Z8H6_9RHOB|nr:hypothetical protein [Paracoccus lutimaris]RCW88760.1 hypothetical protein DFP89_101196 [Paracoccus lutimaris]
MTMQDQIIGFRRDRIGARLICLLNVMRLSRKFGVNGKYLWLSEPGGPYPELADPRDFLTAEFVARHIRVVDGPPDLGARRNASAVVPGLSAAAFAATLAEGRRYECDSMSEIVRVMDEPAIEAEAGMRDVAAGLRLAPRLAAALSHARAAIARVGGGDPIAIHVRRGDILDGDPWSYSSWPSKYVPDEFFRAFIAQSTGPVIAFSDTPAAVAHLAQGNPRVVPAGALFDGDSLSPAARDLLELMLMSECAEVGAPSQSAFSRAAAIMGPCQIAALPAALSPETRIAAYDALLDRAIACPDSFHGPGDLAQSLGYAAKHAVTTGRSNELIEMLAGRDGFLDRFPFLYRELAVMAWASGRMQKARRLAQDGLAAPLMRNRDKPQCRQVLLVTESGDKDTIAQDTEAQFLTMLLTGRAAEGPIIPTLAHRLLSQPDNAVARTMQVAPVILPLYTQPAPEGARSGETLPLWLLRLDWAEFLGNPALQRELLQAVGMWQKIKPAADGLDEIEAALAAGDTPAVTAADAARFGHCASVLRLHGRLKRAFALLHWLDAAHPDQPMTHKRLADTCFAAGNRKAGWRWLNSAQQLSGANAMLRLSAAIRATQEADTATAERHLAKAAEHWPGLGLIATVRRDFQPRLP